MEKFHSFTNSFEFFHNGKRWCGISMQMALMWVKIDLFPPQWIWLTTECDDAHAQNTGSDVVKSGAPSEQSNNRRDYLQVGGGGGRQMKWRCAGL